MKIVKLINIYYKLLHFINFDTHRNFRKKIIKQNTLKKEHLYDYGEGMFYQSIPPIKMNGLRDTKKRIKKLKLDIYLLDKEVLDIGTNIGAIPISSNKNFKGCIGIDHNSDVIDIANKVKDYLNIKKIKFICGDFLKYNFEKNFDVVLSLANHSTFDKGIDDSNYYFKKINEILNDNGILILESHSPLYEKSTSYLNLVETLQKNFKIIDSGHYEFGNFYDKNRKFHILEKK
jgi:ubiquinone/menaquinone biosynthesis C-methylase UbiE